MQAAERLDMHILMVDDDRVDIEVIQQTISEGDGQLTLAVCHTIKEAELVLAEGGIDIVLLDMFLTDSEGLSGLKQLILLFPEIPIVVLTGQYDARIAEEAFQIGAEDFIPKVAMSYEDLARILRHAKWRHDDKRLLRRLGMQ